MCLYRTSVTVLLDLDVNIRHSFNVHVHVPVLNIFWARDISVFTILPTPYVSFHVTTIYNNHGCTHKPGIKHINHWYIHFCVRARTHRCGNPALVIIYSKTTYSTVYAPRNCRRCRVRVPKRLRMIISSVRQTFYLSSSRSGLQL